MTKSQNIFYGKTYITLRRMKDVEMDIWADNVASFLNMSMLNDLNKFIDNDLVEFIVGCDLDNKPEIIELSLEQYLESDLFS